MEKGVNWEDLKFFVAVCRHRSIRSAAQALGVNHATVSRRINSFEQDVGERLFERSLKGYECTRAGKDLFEEAAALEEQLKAIERKIAGRDNSLYGEIRVTMPDVFAEKLLIQDFADFCEHYPNIELNLLDVARPLNLANREADVAFRVCEEPPDYLVGRKLANLHRSVYIAKRHASKAQDPEWLAKQHWLGWTDKIRKPVGRLAREYPRFDAKHKIVSASLQIEACKAGMGVAVLPCFCGDAEPELMRLPPAISVPRWELWMLSHPDMRQNQKVQTFVRFMAERVAAKKALIEGELYATKSAST